MFRSFNLILLDRSESKIVDDLALDSHYSSIDPLKPNSFPFLYHFTLQLSTVHNHDMLKKCTCTDIDIDKHLEWEDEE